MDKFVELINLALGIIWGPWLTWTLIAIGVYFTVGTRFLQVRKFGYIMRQTVGKIFDKHEEDKSQGTLKPFQAAATALASTIGVGSIVGVATAVAYGGPGAIFWMWAAAFVGMCTKYAEILLSIEFREKNEQGNYVGGPAYYMKKGLNSPLLAIIFTIALAFSCLGGNMVQSSSIAETMTEFFGVSPVVTGVVIIGFVALVSIGGIKRLGKVAEKIVPFMAVLYLLGGIIVLIMNFTQILPAFKQIFVCAFTSQSVAGGVGGYAVAEAMRLGVARGLYSNEAGLGSAPIAHATAITDHPARQGMWGIFEVFSVTMVICTVSGLAILTTGINASDASPAVWISMAYGSVVPFFKYIVGISLVLFAYTTIIAISYYGESVLSSFVSPLAGTIYRYIFLPVSLLGAVGGLKVAWGLTDVFLGIQVIPNLFAIVILSPIVFKRTREFFDSGDFD